MFSQPVATSVMAAADSASTSIDVSVLISAPELKKRILKGVEHTGKSLGIGHYGEIEKLKMNGRKVIGKRLHTLPSSGRDSENILLQKFIFECELLSELRHPNIIEFLGLCYLPNPRDHTEAQQPVMVMESVENDLYHLLDTQANVKLSTKVSILHDISNGLEYLHSHSPPVIHMDLMSSNILLTKSLQAKISNLSNAQYLNGPGSKSRQNVNSAPGSVVYMPPEASGSKIQRSTCIDLFSFGVILLHTITQVFPGDLPPPKYTDEGLKKSKVKICTEIERRAPYIEIACDQLGEGHLLLKLICRCLENQPKDRPTAMNASSQLKDVKAMMNSRDDVDAQENHNKVKLRKAVRFDGVRERSSETVENAEQRIRHQSMSFMHTHVLVSHAWGR